MPLLKIDDQVLEVARGVRVLDAALEAGIEIPHYCYHPALSVVGSCRMCLVEIEGMPKLQISCATAVGEMPAEKKFDGKYDMVVHTQTDKVAAARKLVLEFLLLNHPLDCPVCDQAGECDLQDYSFKYGHAHSRFIEDKRVRVAEELGSGVVINQDRCILCTRCVRFTREISGTDELFVMNRGYNNKVSIFEGQPLDNPLAGNVADICPVGALLLKDYMHTTRVWHLSGTASTCVECTTGCSITVDLTNDRIHRIISRPNAQANGHFICDYGRYSFHKYETGIISEPQFKDGDEWRGISWNEAYAKIAAGVKESGGKHNIRALASPTYPNETNYLLGQLIANISDRKSIALLPVLNEEEQLFPSGFKISADKGGNRRGALDMLGSLVDEPQNLYRGDVGVLICLDGDGRAQVDSEIEKLLKASPFKVAIASNYSELTSQVDLILPVAGPYAREGTVTNEQGLVQWLQPALDIPAGIKPDWQVVAELSHLITGEEFLFTGAGDVTWKINHSVSGYKHITRFKIGNVGQFVEVAK